MNLLEIKRNYGCSSNLPYLVCPHNPTNHLKKTKKTQKKKSMNQFMLIKESTTDSMPIFLGSCSQLYSSYIKNINVKADLGFKFDGFNLEGF